MSKFKKNETNVLDAYELKQYVNRRLPIGYAASVSVDDNGTIIDIYDVDVLVKSISVDGLSQDAAEKKIDRELEDF